MSVAAPTDMIFTLGSAHDGLRERIVKLCETWWFKELPNKDCVIPQTIAFLLMRSLSPDAKQSDVKRVFAFRQTLVMLDFAHPSCEPLRAELLQCLISPKFLQCNEVRSPERFGGGAQVVFLPLAQATGHQGQRLDGRVP